MTTDAQTLVSVVMLGGFIWALFFRLPMAKREQDQVSVVYSVVLALLALFGWLFVGVGTR
jgi:uncharacterized YccA/Bax inhibitor family protein